MNAGRGNLTSERRLGVESSDASGITGMPLDIPSLISGERNVAIPSRDSSQGLPGVW